MPVYPGARTDETFSLGSPPGFRIFLHHDPGETIFIHAGIKYFSPLFSIAWPPPRLAAPFPNATVGSGSSPAQAGPQPILILARMVLLYDGIELPEPLSLTEVTDR
jgi:hypothetical protein